MLSNEDRPAKSWNAAGCSVSLYITGDGITIIALLLKISREGSKTPTMGSSAPMPISPESGELTCDDGLSTFAGDICLVRDASCRREERDIGSRRTFGLKISG